LIKKTGNDSGQETTTNWEKNEELEKNEPVTPSWGYSLPAKFVVALSVWLHRYHDSSMALPPPNFAPWARKTAKSKEHI
jgi:hypothetical protein